MASTASLLAKRPVIEGLTANIDGARARLEIRFACNSARRTDCGDDDLLGEVERSSKERNAIFADLSSKLLLSQVYFGPKTSQAVRDLQGDPWSAPDTKLQALTQAMADELAYFDNTNQ